MASNGYVRRCCSNCIFYEHYREYGEWCTLKGTIFEAELMKWISAIDYESNSLMKKKYDEKCEHFTSLCNIKNQIREKFKIKKYK